MGTIPGGGGSVRPPRLIAPGRASEAILPVRPVSADEAARVGWINAVLAPGPPVCEELLAWLAMTTQELLDALRAADPDGSCWTGWGATRLTDTCGSVARHQGQEIAVHTYDAQAAMGAPQPLPTEVVLDGVDENLFITCFTTSPWPHKPTAFGLHAIEGRSWRHTVDGDGARTTRLPAPGEDPDAAGLSIRGTASDLVLFRY